MKQIKLNKFYLLIPFHSVNSCCKKVSAFASTDGLIPSSKSPSDFDRMAFQQQLLESDLNLKLRSTSLAIFDNKPDLIVLPKLSNLSYKFIGLGPKGAKFLALALQQNSSITSLNLESNKIGSDGAKDLASALQQNSSITSLNLESNKIGSDGAKDLASALQSNSSITFLNLGYNKIGFDGAHSIANAVRHNSSITCLNLCNNPLRDDGVKLLADALQHNSSVTKLNFKCIQIEDNGAQALTTALKSNLTITFLDLGYNRIRHVGAKALLGLLDTNTIISTLILHHNLSSLHEVLEKINTILSKRNNQSLINKKSTSSAKRPATAFEPPAILSSNPHSFLTPQTLPTPPLEQLHYTPGLIIKKKLESYLDLLIEDGLAQTHHKKKRSS